MVSRQRRTEQRCGVALFVCKHILADDCNYSGFVADRRTFAIGAIAADGKPTYYSERCSGEHSVYVVFMHTFTAHLVVAPSSGAFLAAKGGLSGMMAGTRWLQTGCVLIWLFLL